MSYASLQVCKLCVCRFLHGEKNWVGLLSHSASPYSCYISISAGGLSSNKKVPPLSLRLNVKHAADTAWEVFLLCFILFPRHYILTLTFGCDKRKALNPTHIHSEFQPLDPNSTPTLQHTAILLHSSWTMLGFRLYAWGLFTLPIANICNANDWVTVFFSLAGRGCIFSRQLCPFMFMSSLQIHYSLLFFSFEIL